MQTLGAIHWLGEDGCHHPEVVGGKAASLSRLASLHPVPPGFAIPALPATVESLPEGLAGAVRHAYDALGERCGHPAPPVAVRSSAIDEDGTEASFAGQHQTYLNVRGAGPLLDAVLSCVHSAASEQALAYRGQHGLDPAELRIAVLVQHLVPADVAAVAFSANPITGSRDEIMINANWGLGESIVSGCATPDTFIVDKSSMCVTWRDIARKERMTALVEAGTSEVPVPAPLQSKSSLVDEDVVRIARLAGTLEQTEGRAVDIECAIAGDALYLLQCRPITTLG